MKISTKLTIAVGTMAFLALIVSVIIFGGFNTDNLNPVITQTVSANPQPDKNTSRVKDTLFRDETSYVFSTLENTTGLTNADKMILFNTAKDDLGFIHKSYQHYYRGIKVEGSKYMIDEKNGKITSTGGRIIRLPELSITPSISSERAFEKAKEYVGTEKYIWDDNKTKIPKGELVIDPLNKNFDGNQFNLCWHFSINSLKPFKSVEIYINAHTGKENSRVSNIYNADKVGSAKLLYNANAENITTDSYTVGSTNQYRLRESSRNIWTLNGLMNSLAYRAKSVDFTNEDNSWNDEFFPSHIKKTGCQTYWGFEKVYDYFLKQGLKSYDGKGALIEGYLNVDIAEWDLFNWQNNNAFWSGTQYHCFAFPSGGWFSDYIVGLDVIGHEFTHAIIDYHGGLLYKNETGALNESFADIFGTVVEFNTKANGNWTIGEDSKILRSMSDPKLYKQPNTYKGKNWHDISDQSDEGGVHTNSGVQNFWFYLLCNGGTNKNDLEKQYSVTGIGMNKAAAIVLQIILNHCNKIFDYNSARQASLIAATEKNGSNSAEYNAVNAAWYAVGVGINPPTNINATDGTYSDKIRISWASKSGEYYQVYRNTSDNSSTATSISNWMQAGINFDDTSAAPGTIYYYWAKAANNSAGTYASIFSVSDKGSKLQSTCAAASNLSTTNITTSGARINFTLPGSLNSVALEYRNSNTSTWTTKSIATNYLYNDLTGLNASTKYYYRIKTICTNGVCNYSGEYSFTTTAAPTCSAASNLSSSNISTSGARINFTLPGSLSSASLEYRNSNTSTWTTKSIATNYTYNDLTGLNSSTKYYFRIKTVCANGATSYTAEYNFTTSAIVASCAAASNLTASNISSSGARINFTLPGSLSSASLEYRNSNTSTWSSKSIATNYTYNDLTGLNSSTKYYFRIKTVCSNGAISYTSEYSFTTSATVASCAAASSLSASNVTSTTARVKFTLPGNISSAAIEYKTANATFWYSYSMPVSYSYIDFSGLVKLTTYNIRIKVTCTNGQSSYSNTLSFTTIGTKSAMIDTGDPIIKISPLSSTEFSARCFPNPAQDKLSVNIMDSQDQIFDCKVLNMFGQPVFSEKFNGDQTLEIDVSRFTRGVYVVVISNSDSVKQFKIVLQ